jgi:alanyl-tRNA synthetase
MAQNSATQTSAAVRRAFLDYFAGNGHTVVQSGPLVPANDPTLMFTSAGMVQFKSLFTGQEQRAYKRATTSQKCMRIAGKHNDFENVGPSPRHHTFFEMLGNFSFGDYFKEQAIVYAWEFLTRELQLPPERLVVTYFGGEAGVAADEEARQLWKKLTGFGDDRIRGLGMSDNFWSAGDTGPCGPCSEIHIFNGPKTDPSTFGAEQTTEGFGWMEIWNLVFMQFERDSSGTFKPLPAPSIDTGMGLERIVGVVQGVTNNYDTDILRGLVDVAARISKKKYGGTMAPDDVSMRVIADHARSTAFLLAEGVMPEKTGREYVLRRVMRRAIRHGHRLGISKPFLHEVALEVGKLMGDQYPELRQHQELIATVCEQEEVRFRQTIERGLALLDERFEVMGKAGSKVLDGEDAFKLYDTYGFPLDLTQVICKERGYSVDEPGYDRALEEARKRSEFKGADQAVEAVYRDAVKLVPKEQVRFLGYEMDSAEGKIVALLVNGALAQQARQGDEVEIVCDQTPFYGEAGGQLGDQGRIETSTGAVEVVDTQKPVAGLVTHKGKVAQGTLQLGQPAKLLVDTARREATRRNHSATHLLHWALRQVVGAHAQQKGSMVGPERLRFDFTHGAPLTDEQIARIEDLVNERVLQNEAISTDVVSMDQARQRGAMMIFEEKYGDTVRMLKISDSVELCGGTHARATGDIGLFKIVSEQGIAAGVRRIIGTTARPSLGYVRELEGQLAQISRVLKASGADLGERVEKLVQHERALEKKIEELQRKLALGGGGVDALLGQARDVAGVKVLGARSDVTDRAALRELAETLRDKLGNSVVLIASESEGKAQLVLTVAKPLTQKLKAGDLIRPIAEIVGGSGGGRPDMAQAGGTDPSRIDEAVAAVYKTVQASAG